MEEHILTLDKPRPLHYRAASFALIKELTGIQDLKELMGLDSRYIPVLAWVGLLEEDPELPLERAQKLIAERTQGNDVAMGGIALTVLEAIKDTVEKACREHAKSRIPGRRKRR